MGLICGFSLGPQASLDRSKDDFRNRKSLNSLLDHGSRSQTFRHCGCSLWYHFWGLLLQRALARAAFLLQCGLSISGEKYKPHVLGVFQFASLSSDTTTSLGPGKTKSSKRSARTDSVMDEYFTLLCFFCSIIQKAIHVDADKASSWIWPLSDPVGVWFYEEYTAEDQHKTKHCTHRPTRPGLDQSVKQYNRTPASMCC